MVKGAFGVGNHGVMRGMMTGNFCQLGGGDGAHGARRGEDDFCGVREEQAGDFVDSFVAKGSVEQPKFAILEILLEETGEFAGGAGIVRAVQINVRGGLQFFKTAGPDGVGDSIGYGFIVDSKTAVLKEPAAATAFRAF
jgi:hypothetical protein